MEKGLVLLAQESRYSKSKLTNDADVILMQCWGIQNTHFYFEKKKKKEKENLDWWRLIRILRGNQKTEFSDHYIKDTHVT